MPTREVDHEKQLRLRKVYIQLRIPRVRAEIRHSCNSKKLVDERVRSPSVEGKHRGIDYSNQHMAALRKELESFGGGA